MKVSRGYIHPQRQDSTSPAQFTVMAAKATQHSAQVLRAWQSALPIPPAHRRPIVSSLIWSLSSPSASLPYLKPTPWPTPALSQVTKRGMATLSKSKNLKRQETEEESLARFHRVVRDESESAVDIWALPLESLGVFVCHLETHYWLTRIPKTGLRTLTKTFTFRHFLHEWRTPLCAIILHSFEIIS